MRLSDIRRDWQVFARDGAVAIGAVRDVSATAIEVYIEAYGDVTLDPDQIASAHDEKVVLDLAALPEDLRDAIKRAHDGEDYRP